MEAQPKAKLGRRQLFRAIGVAAASVAAAAPVASPALADSEGTDDKRKPRYKESDHVKAYYRVNRYPS
ncbi:MAG TPA: hypothetical protein VGQ90_17210 [Stellaceae bacterium]|jgi:hypothetical protein|nr:hypothetical protein [Stellaceae bacterium]